MRKLLIVLLAILPLQASAYGYDCESSIDSYNTAINDVSYALKRYTNCLSSSQGRDDCSYEFRKVKYAQDAIESGVSDISSHCE